jgi:hypothetical protein
MVRPDAEPSHQCWDTVGSNKRFQVYKLLQVKRALLRSDQAECCDDFMVAILRTCDKVEGSVLKAIARNVPQVRTIYGALQITRTRPVLSACQLEYQSVEQDPAS